MKTHYLIILSFLFTTCFAQSESDAVIDVMKNISNGSQKIKLLTFPRPNERIDRELETFETYSKYIERDLAELGKLDKNAETSTRDIWGKPFASRLQEALRVIKLNRQNLTAAKAAMPKPEALKKIDGAIFDAGLGTKQLNNPERLHATISSLSFLYDQYQKQRAQAVEIDPRVLDYRKAELAKCETDFVERFLALKRQYEQAEASKIATQRAAEAKIAREAAMALQIENEHNAALAKARGFAAYHVGIVSLIHDFQTDNASVENSKAKLVLVDESDAFEVINSSEQHVFYQLRQRRGELLQIAVERETGKAYLSGSELAGSMFQLLGVGRFKNALGIEKDLLIFKRIKERQ